MKTMTSKENQIEAKKRNPLVKDFEIFNGTNDLTSLIGLVKENKPVNVNERH